MAKLSAKLQSNEEKICKKRAITLDLLSGWWVIFGVHAVLRPLHGKSALNRQGPNRRDLSAQGSAGIQIPKPHLRSEGGRHAVSQKLSAGVKWRTLRD